MFKQKNSMPNRIAVSIEEAAEMVGIGRSTLYGKLSAGELPSMKIGKRRLIRVDALNAWVAEQEAASSPRLPDA